uniref:Uncharacterized protein n=1 Tax=Anguilla anguilla TaxID=7936 RepID=A0A0E9U3T3_ANGAN
MVLTNVSGDLISMMSEIGATSSLAATLGRRFLPNAEAPAQMCVKLNCCWVARIKGVNSSRQGSFVCIMLCQQNFWTP